MTRPEVGAVRSVAGLTVRFLTDWRVWLGLAVTAIALFFTLRGVSFSEVGAALAQANLLLLTLTIPLHWATLWVRALRWRHLAEPISTEPIPIGALYRATAVGFMAINILPLRIGELVRPWLLSRETGVRGSAALGTLVLERAIDFTSLAAIGAGVLAAHRQSLPGWVRGGAAVFAVLSCIPFALAFALRRNEEGTLRLLSRVVRILPERLGERALDVLTEVCRGLNALRGRRAIGMVVLYSAVMWGGIFVAPMALGLYAFGIDLPPGKAVLASYTALTFTALAVAAPSAPGFFGVYHFACREALALFGVSSATAVAYGTTLHLFYWVPVTLFGVVAALRSGMRISDLAAPSLGQARSRQHR